MEIPHALKQAVREGKVVLFLGAGSSIGAFAADGSKPPQGDMLARMLSERFLGGEDSDQSLSVVSEYAISETDLITVQQYLRDIFDKFQPADFHLLLPTFRWTAIGTTNYDLIIERAYAACHAAAQDLVLFLRNSDRIESKLRSENAVPYIKLHGCISRHDQPEIPLILTIDQYVTHKKNRGKLFERLKDYGAEHPIVFVGHRLEDPDLRQIILELTDEGISRPRYYLVTPNPNERQKRFWESKKITALPGTFEEFLKALHEELDESLRKLTFPEPVHEITRRFTTSCYQLSAEALRFLNLSVTYIIPHLPTSQTSPQDFFRGYSYGWDAIQRQYDSRRDLEDTILSDVILVDDVDRQNIADLYLIKGHAGSGKTIIMKRIAWDAATQFEKMCLYHDGGSPLDSECVFEILDNVAERLFLFVESAADRASDIAKIIYKARKLKHRLTLVVSERGNEWNSHCESINYLIDEVYEIKYLSKAEIPLLIDKLKQHSALGLLSEMTPEAQHQAFEKKAGRQLLVALHEATLGKPFEDIILNEFRKISSDSARRIYQTICVLNRLEIPVRAGIIRRVHGITFDEFKEKFFAPLESIVYSRHHPASQDMAYYARHTWIAEIVFERSLLTPGDRLDIYLKLLSALDIGYEADRKAYRNLIKARELLRLFPDPIMVRKIYDAAQNFSSGDAYFHQQQSIYEMKRENPNYQAAYEGLKRAEKLAPRDSSIAHSLAELELARSRNARGGLEAERHMSAAAQIARSITGNKADTSYGYHTLCKIAFERLKLQLAENPDNDPAIAELTKSIGNTIRAGLEKFPDDTYLLHAEFKLARQISENDRAVHALQRAFSINSMNSFIARALAHLYEARGDIANSRAVLEKCIEGLPGDKSMHEALAHLLTKKFPKEGMLAEYHWRRAFTEGDSNYNSQFWYARQLYINGKKDDSSKMFDTLRSARVTPDAKRQIRGPILGEDGAPKRIRGKVEKKEANYATLSQELDVTLVLLDRSQVKGRMWNELKKGMSVTYNVGFTYRGLGAFNVNKEKW